MSNLMTNLAAALGAVVLAYLAVKAAPWAGINLKPVMVFVSILFIVMGVTLLLIDVRNGSADGNLILGSALVAAGVMKLMPRTA